MIAAASMSVVRAAAPRRYIVVFKERVNKDQVDRHADSITGNGGAIIAHLNPLLNGFSATIPDEFLQGFQSDFEGDIDFIEEDSEVRTQ